VIAEPLLPLARPVAELRLLDGNPRRGDVAACKRSLKRFGQRKPIVVREDGTVEAGNTTLKAALELGWTEIAVVAFGDDDATAKAFALADNRTSELGTFDLAALAAMAVEVQAADPELLAAASYTEADLNALLAGLRVPEKRTDPDAVPDAPAEPVTQLADLWLLGPHRLLCGDSTDPADLARLMDGETADLVFTDPPYNADYSSRVDKQRRKPWGGITNDALPEDEYEAFLARALSCIPAVTAKGAAVYVWTDWHHYSLVERLYRERFLQKALIIWDKGHFGLGTYYRTQHELLLFGVLGSTVATWNAGHDERDVWQVSRDPLGNYAHPTQKPVELCTRAISNSAPQAGTVLDLFGGSGSTLIAAHGTDRVARLMELEPPYCDVICRRYQEHTGTKPVLESTGQPHDFT
jgi:DNA modification methylase